MNRTREFRLVVDEGNGALAMHLVGDMKREVHVSAADALRPQLAAIVLDALRREIRGDGATERDS